MVPKKDGCFPIRLPPFAKRMSNKPGNCFSRAYPRMSLNARWSGSGRSKRAGTIKAARVCGMPDDKDASLCERKRLLMLRRLLLFCLLLVFMFSSIQAVPTLRQSDDFDLAVKAIKERNVSELRTLLEKDRKLVEKADDKIGATLLHWAAVERDVDIIKLLVLEYQASLAAQNKEKATPVMLALVPNP